MRLYLAAALVVALLLMSSHSADADSKGKGGSSRKGKGASLLQGQLTKLRENLQKGGLRRSRKGSNAGSPAKGRPAALPGACRESRHPWLEDDCTKMFFCKNGRKLQYLKWKGCPKPSQCKNNKCACPEDMKVKKKHDSLGEVKCSPAKKLPSGKPTRLSCNKGFVKLGERCLRGSPHKSDLDSAMSKCRGKGARLLTFKNLMSDPIGLYRTLISNAHLRRYSKGVYWIGGVQDFDDDDLFVGGSLSREGDDEALLSTAQRMERGLMQTVLGKLAASLKPPCRQLLCGRRTSENLKACGEFKDKCLVFAPGEQMKVQLRRCSDKYLFVCEGSLEAEEEEDWEYTEYINTDTPGTTGDHESRSRAARAWAKKGKCLCKRPLGIRARIRNTQTLLSKKDTQGYRFTLSPRRGFRCLNKDQGGKSCPDVEVAYACPVEKNKCDDDGNREKCEKMNRDCVDKCGGGHYCRRRKAPKPNKINAGKCCLDGAEDQCTETGVCTASGDPHYVTFDGQRIDYMGPCRYLIVEGVYASEGCPNFIVEAENRPRPGTTATWLKTITFRYAGYVVDLRQGKEIAVNGQVVTLPYEVNEFSITALGAGILDNVLLKTDFCLQIFWNGDRKLKVEAPVACKKRVTGICGNWDGETTNDWRKKTGEMVDMSQSQRERSKELGDSYEVPNPDTTLGSCMSKALRECNPEEDARYRASDSCGVLTNPDGPFKEHLLVPAIKQSLEASMDMCMDDMCNSVVPELCPAITKVAEDLQASFDIPLPADWRNSIPGCVPKCPGNMTFDAAMSVCQPTCLDDPEDDARICPDPTTRAGCRCNDGLVLSGLRCVARSECGCESPVMYLLPGAEAVDEDCEYRYKCVVGADGEANLVTEKFGNCDEHATCKNGRCHCNAGYEGNGKSCQAKPVKCPRGWVKQGSMCYRTFKVRRTWLDAQKECGCKTGGMAQLCAAHTDEQLTFLEEFYSKRRVKNGYWGGGNTVAQKTVNNDVILQTTPSRKLVAPDEAGCHTLRRSRSGKMTIDVENCESKRGYCCMIDPMAIRDGPKEWTPKMKPWKIPEGGRAFIFNQAYRMKMPMCPHPFDLECMTEDGRPWNVTGQRAMCNVRRGFICEGRDCTDYRIRGLCLKDHNECEILGSDACPGGKKCYNCIGGYDCRCPGESRPNRQGICQAPTHPGCGECRASGDPHYVSMSGKRFDWQGKCKYVLTETCPHKMLGNPPFPCYRIVVKNTKCGTSTKDVTCTYYVEVHIFKKCSEMDLPNSQRTMITLHRKGTYSYGGVSNRRDPLCGRDFSVYTMPSGKKTVVLVTNFDLKVTFSGSTVIVTPPPGSDGRMCGLCGDCSTPDSFELRNGTTVPIQMRGRKIDPSVITQVALAYEIPDPSEPSCDVPDPDEEPTCTEAEMDIIRDEKHCGFFKSPMFENCRTVADESFVDCEMDLCARMNKDDFEKINCDRIAEAVQKCRSAMGENAPQLFWRAQDFCPLECPMNETFSSNAELDELCSASPTEDNAEAALPVEGCVCQSGLKRNSDDKCVEPSQCGCTVTYGDGAIYIEAGKTLSVDNNCRQGLCQNGEIKYLDDKTLSNNGECDSSKVPAEPKCRTGYEGDGFTCTKTLECEDGWVEMSDKCVFLSPDLLPWTLAAQKCSEMDGFLVTCESEPECQEFERLLKTDPGVMYWTRGQLLAISEEELKPLLEARAIEPNATGANNYFSVSLLEELKPLDPTGFQVGDRLCYAAADNNEGIAFAYVNCKQPVKFACAKRDPNEPKVYTEYCFSDDASSKSQEETTAAMNEAGCKICKEPMDVDCVAVDDSNAGKEQVDHCGEGGEKIYYCKQSEQANNTDCYAKKIRGKCFPGLDECALNIHDCGPNAVCEDKFYGFDCLCKPNFVSRDGECIETETCVMSPSSEGASMRITPYEANTLSFRTRCTYVLASSCQDAAAPDDRPDYEIRVASDLEESEVIDYTRVRIEMKLTYRGRDYSIQVSRSLASNGKILVDGNEVALPYGGLSSDVGLKVFSGGNGMVVVTRPRAQDLRVEICFSFECQNTVKIRTPTSHDTKCGVCSVTDADNSKSAVEILEENIATDSPVSCAEGPPSEPPPRPPPGETTNPGEEGQEPPAPEDTTLPPPPPSCDKFKPDCSVITDEDDLPFVVCGNREELYTKCLIEMCKERDRCQVFNDLLRDPQCIISSLTPDKRDNLETEFACKMQFEDDCEKIYGVESKCGILLLNNGPFSTCDNREQAYEECLQSSCSETDPNMCPFLESFAQGCLSITQAQKRSFMKMTKCMPTCPTGMRFSFNTRTEAPSCEDPYEVEPTGESAMGCVCADGMLMSGGKCIPRSQCGCSVNTQYYERGAQWNDNNCTKTFRCDGPSDIREMAMNCGPNSQCDGQGRCVCRPGTMGDCCGEIDDRGTMTCYPDCEGGTICQCKMGYAALCGDCVDHDECQSGQHTCPENTKCVNTPGGYSCDCLTGFRKDPYTKKCKDINECAEAEDSGKRLCQRYSQCVNKNGGFQCVCCAGFVLNEENECVADSINGTPATPDRACCRCMGPKCLLTGSFCYTETDGKKTDYASYKDMYQTRCIEGKTLLATSYSDGTCENPAPVPTTPAPEAPGGGNEGGGEGPCGDSICSDADKATPNGGALCVDSTKITYPTLCELKKATCKANNNSPSPVLPAFSPGPCPTPTPPPTQAPPNFTFSQWNAWTSCKSNDPTLLCGGSGKRQRTRTKTSGLGSPPSDLLMQTEECALPTCAGKPPVTEAPCPSPASCPTSTDYVCARLNNDVDPVTFRNPCFFDVEVCKTKSDSSKVLHRGMCNPGEENPTHFPCEGGNIPEVVRSHDTLSADGMHCVGEDVVVNSCDGGFCNSVDPSVCCKATDFIYKSSLIQCFKNDTLVSTRKVDYQSATRCECQNPE